MTGIERRLRLPAARPFKSYTQKKVNITHDHDREIRLLQAALADRHTPLSYSQVIEIMIDDFLGKLK